MAYNPDHYEMKPGLPLFSLLVKFAAEPIKFA